jgi:hypothetical protein
MELVAWAKFAQNEAARQSPQGDNAKCKVDAQLRFLAWVKTN